MADEPDKSSEAAFPTVTFAILTLTTLIEVGLWRSIANASDPLGGLAFASAAMLGWLVMLGTALIVAIRGIVRRNRDRQARALGEQTPVRQPRLLITGFLVAIVVNVGIVLIWKR